MDQFPSEEEEYELRYQDELEMLNQVPDVPVVNTQPRASGSENTPSVQDNRSFLTASPQLSQISGAVNRCLFGTPTGAKRAFSTPIAKKMPTIQELVLPTPMGELQNIGISKKRRLDRDLFGEIGSLGDVTYVDPEAKKKKLEEERDREMIQKVLEARRLNSIVNNVGKKPKTDQLDAIHDFKMRNLSYSVPKWPFIPLQRSDQERVYCRYHSVEYENKHIDDITLFNKHYQGLLGESKHQTWNEAREIVLRRMTMSSTQNTNQNQNIYVPQQIPAGSTNLWVEKYKPKKYIDLLSDEGTNRNLLLWLKMWDKAVFGKEFIPKENQPSGKGYNNFNKLTGKFEVTGGWAKKNKQSLNTNIDHLGRPMQKVALLCGPPGLGKTTLAHTIARHAGYQVLELNASDDRSPEAFQLALENGTQMSSVLNPDKRPNCIILDEIDGAPRPSIEFLVRFISDNVVAKAKKKGGKVAKNILRRPIICICNDLYEPSLRQLRQVAFVVTFPPINSSRLAERLLEIARREHIKTDFGTLFALAEKSGNDVRSCISTLQFFKVLKKAVTLTDVLNSSLGLKDRHRSLFDIWSSIFKIQKPQRQLDATGAVDGGPLVTVSDNSRATRMRQVLEIVHSGGDYEILTQGVYENYLHQKMPDPNMDGVSDATQWFCFSDILQQQIKHLQNYTVYPYLQYGFVVWHLHFASLAWPTVHFPIRGHEFKQKLTTQRQIFTSLRKGIASNVVGIGQGTVILVETVPMLKRILSAKIRPVAEQLLTEKEKMEYTQTVNIMVDMGISLNQARNPDGTYKFLMEPDLDLLGQFPGFPGVTLSYIGKTHIARDIQIERMRRANPRSDASETKVVQKKKTLVFSSTSSRSLLPDPSDEKTKKKKEAPRDIFGRIIEKTVEELAREAESDPILKSPIYFKYKLGFTNAVRRDVLMNELL